MLAFDKWYFDAQAPGGLVYGWLAEMALFGKRFGLVQVNLVDGDSARSVLRRYPGREVRIAGDDFRVGPSSILADGQGGLRLVLDVGDDRFGGTLEIRPSRPAWYPEPSPLYEGRGLLGRKRSLEWWVPVPRAEVDLGIGAFRAAGTGYLDRVRLSMPPWALPFRTLWWGRAFAGDRTAVFLRAERRDGGPALEIGLDGERAASLVAVEERGSGWTVRLDGSALELGEPRAVKDEEIAVGIGVRSRLSRAIQNRLAGSPVQRRFLFHGPGLLAVAERVEWTWR